MIYNTTWMDSSNTLGSLVTGVNVMSNNLFVILVLVAIWMIVFFKTNDQGTSKSLITSGFVTSIIGILFWFMNLLTWELLIVPVIVFLTGIIINYFE